MRNTFEINNHYFAPPSDSNESNSDDNSSSLETEDLVNRYDFGKPMHHMRHREKQQKRECELSSGKANISSYNDLHRQEKGLSCDNQSNRDYHHENRVRSIKSIHKDILKVKESQL